MRHKYVITLDNENEKMVLQEYGELDKDIFTIVSEERYQRSVIQGAMGQGIDPLIHAMRTRDFYPCGTVAAKIASSVITLLEGQSETAIEVICDDSDYLTKKGSPVIFVEDVEDDAPDVADLLEDDFVPDFDDDIDTKGVDSSISIDMSSEADIDEDI
ncbi:MAG: hypothetical protein RBT11_01350 [Desulfobacterales bacterium]|jgi:hypothetical protein|nr:hypothetical protein [Desulfobacterales bacterium]